MNTPKIKTYSVVVTVESPIDWCDINAAGAQIGAALRHHLTCAGVAVVDIAPAPKAALVIRDEGGAWNGRGPVVTLHETREAAEAAGAVCAQ